MQRHARRGLRFVTFAALAAFTAGCSATSGQIPLATGSSFGPTVAFESVDGPPPQVFDRLVRALEAESASKSFTIVSREAPAAYRIRSYLSAQVSRRGKTTIAWVWDVYDRDQQRALRLSGEEPGGKAGRDAWAIADDQLIRKIAAAGLNGVSSMMNGTLPQNSPGPAAPGTGPAVASASENTPESAADEPTTLAFSAR